MNVAQFGQMLQGVIHGDPEKVKALEVNLRASFPYAKVETGSQIWLMLYQQAT